MNKIFSFPLLLFILCLGGTVSWSQDNSSFLEYHNAPLGEVLNRYETLSGKHLIIDPAIPANTPVTLSASGVDKNRMIELIDSVLMLNGIGIVSVDDQTSKAILLGSTKNPRSEGVMLYSDVSQFPPGEEIISYYMPLQYIEPQEAQTIFTQQSPPHSYGSYVPAPSSKAIILTENTRTIRQLIELQKMVDSPPTMVVTDCVKLENTDAVEVAKIITNFLGPKTDVTAAPLSSGVIPPASTAPVLNQPSEFNVLVGPTRIAPDSRSNRIFIITRPYNLPFLEGLIAELDKPGQNLTPQRRQLKYVQAQDILQSLKASLAPDETEEKNEPRTSTVASSAPSSPNSSTNPPTSPLSPPQNANNAITAPLQAPVENNIPSVITIGRTRILADSPSNSIIVFGTPEDVSKVFALVDELDQQPLQVYLSTIIGQLQLSKNTELGADLLLKYSNTGKSGIAGSSINNPATTSTNNLPDASTLNANANFPISGGLSLYGVIGNKLDSFITALENTNRFTIVSRPCVFTTNNKLAVIASGSQIPIPASTTSGFSGSQSNLVTTSNIAYQNVLLRLDIIPQINADRQVTLKIRQVNDSIGSNQTISGNSVPTILSQEINTEVTLADKSTVVIGGLISNTKQKTTDDVPFLSKIPLLGSLFKNTSDDNSRSELIIMIQPTVIETEAERMAASEEMKRRSIIQDELKRAADGTEIKEPEPRIKPAMIPPHPSLFPSPSNTSNSTSSDPNSPETNLSLPPELKPQPRP